MNCDPPTQTSYGVEQKPLTPGTVPTVAAGSSQPAAPLSPDDTNTVIPCAAACCHSELYVARIEADILPSQSPKLIVRTGARLLFTMYWAEASSPGVVAVGFVTTKL